MKKTIAVFLLMMSGAVSAQMPPMPEMLIDRFWVEGSSHTNSGNCPTSGIADFSVCHVQNGEDLGTFLWNDDCDGQGNGCWVLTNASSGDPFSEPYVLALWMGVYMYMGQHNLFNMASPYEPIPAGCFDVYNCPHGTHDMPIW